LERNLNVVGTSSAGRLFDAVAALSGVRQEINYEAQAAIEFEGLVECSSIAAVQATPATGDAAATLLHSQTAPYDFALNRRDGIWVIDPTPVLRAVVADVRAGGPAGAIAARFHAGLARAIVAVCSRLREEIALDEVALSGGVFQNVTLLGIVVPLLREAGFTVYAHHLVPPNDAGIALGQAAISTWQPQR
jgi:hydrogenase maturation protein HypF